VPGEKEKKGHRTKGDMWPTVKGEKRATGKRLRVTPGGDRVRRKKTVGHLPWGGTSTGKWEQQCAHPIAKEQVGSTHTAL